MEVKLRKIKTKWSPAAESLLCEMWRERIGQLRGNGKKGHVYKELAEELATHGFIFTGEEVHVKINNLAAKYRKEKQQITSSGGTSSEWPLYGIMHEIFKLNNFERVEVKEENLLAVLEEDNLLPETLASSICQQLPESDDLSPFEFSPSALSPSSMESSASAASAKTSSHATKKRKRTSAFQCLLLEELKTTNKQLNEMLNEDRENTKSMLKIEEQRNRMLEKFVSDTKEFQNSILDLLKNNNKLI